MIDNGSFRRNSDGYSITVGTDLDLSGVLFGNMFIGYDSQSYNDPALNDVSGGLSLVWLPSQLTTITVTIARAIEEPHWVLPLASSPQTHQSLSITITT